MESINKRWNKTKLLLVFLDKTKSVQPNSLKNFLQKVIKHAFGIEYQAMLESIQSYRKQTAKTDTYK